MKPQDQNTILGNLDRIDEACAVIRSLVQDQDKPTIDKSALRRSIESAVEDALSGISEEVAEAVIDQVDEFLA